LKAAFAQRRKTLQNTLGPFLDSLHLDVGEVFDRAGIDPARRGETLSSEEFLRITTAIQQLQE